MTVLDAPFDPNLAVRTTVPPQMMTVADGVTVRVVDAPTVRGLEVADVRPVAVARSWYGFAGEIGLAWSILQPANVATPFTTIFERPPVHVRRAPGAPVPALIERVTWVAWSWLAVFVGPARTATTGCVVNATPGVAPAGWVVKTSRSATSNWALVAPVRPDEAAASVYPTPTLLIAQPEKVATPFTAAFESPPVQLRVPPPGFAPRLSATVAVLVVTVAPAASWMATTGCVANAPPGVPRAGCVVKASLVAVDPLIAKAALVADVSPDPVAVSV